MKRAALLLLLACCSGPSRTTAPPPHDSGKMQGPHVEVKECCAQCLSASQRDPTGADISHKPCAEYPKDWSGGLGVDEACHSLFAGEPMTVDECSRIAGEK